MQKDVLCSTKEIADGAKSVSIDNAAIETFCESFHWEDITHSESKALKPKSISDTIGAVFIFNSVNFCFWPNPGEEKWKTETGKGPVGGSTGAYAAIERAIQNGIPLFDVRFLANLTRKQVEDIFKANVEIPLLDERLNNLREFGRIVLDKFDGDFMNVFHAANGNAVELTDLFITNFPSFNDFSVIDGKKIEFHKRAQINANMINDYLVKIGEKKLLDLDKLTAFADYKVPQILRKFNILKYCPELAEKVDSSKTIEAGSREEIEIRAATIWTVEHMKETLRAKSKNIDSRQIDDYLWKMGQIKSLTDKPHHLTRTIFY